MSYHLFPLFHETNVILYWAAESLDERHLEKNKMFYSLDEAAMEDRTWRQTSKKILENLHRYELFYI